MAARPPPVVLKAKNLPHTATLIFLHGLGDTGHGWAAALNTIRPDFVKIVCPTAPSIPVSLNSGMVMPAWYDIYDLSARTSGKREDIKGVQVSAKYLADLVDSETSAEVPKSRIVIGGFSQGGAVALSALAKMSSEKLAGCLALSTYLPGDELPGGGAAVADGVVSSEMQGGQIQTPVLQCHGEDDEMITIQRAELSASLLKGIVADHRFHKFPYMGHECIDEELQLVKSFITEVLSP